MLAEAAAEFGGDDPEIGDFHRVVLRDAPQLVPPREVGLRAGPARGHEELNGGVGEVLRRSEEHTSELQSHHDLVCRLLLEKKKKQRQTKSASICHPKQ